MLNPDKPVAAAFAVVATCLILNGFVLPKIYSEKIKEFEKKITLSSTYFYFLLNLFEILANVT